MENRFKRQASPLIKYHQNQIPKILVSSCNESAILETKNNLKSMKIHKLIQTIYKTEEWFAIG